MTLSPNEQEYLERLCEQIPDEQKGDIFIDNDGDIRLEGYFSLKALQQLTGLLTSHWPKGDIS